ncbi:MAG: DUF350 domain-containing protein [Chloroflexi bacterium]|nr:DUF350 domain-containing protein [Chloroflexota bacterium]
MDTQIVAFVARVGATVLWTAVGLVIFFVGVRVYDLMDTSIAYVDEIKRGNVAAAIKLGAVTIGLAAIVVAAIVT